MSGFPKKNIYFPDDCSDESAVLIEATAASINDLNQPLTSLLGLFSLFKRRMAGECADAIRLVERMETEVERMATLTRQLNRLTDDTARTDVLRQRIIASQER
ncbi:MAG: hypothetical protein JXX14_00235 [Deltaproteobacteria bacterium]|nr:hypothetical protein [Deltaproteobacteria bacterium]